MCRWMKSNVIQDRILFRSNTDNDDARTCVGIRSVQYDSIMRLQLSDHKPVFALLKVNVVPMSKRV